MTVKNRSDLQQIIEEPCLKACQELFDKNIETMDSGCNNENCFDCAYIVICYDTLNKTNKEIADKLIDFETFYFEKRNGLNFRQLNNMVRIVVPANLEDTVQSVENRLLATTKRFKPQEKIKREIDYSELIAAGKMPAQRVYE